MVEPMMISVKRVISCAQGTLDMMAISLPTKVVWPIVMQQTTQRIQSPNVDARKSAIACLGVAAEGCKDEILKGNILDEVVQCTLAAAADPELKVREVACFTLG